MIFDNRHNLVGTKAPEVIGTRWFNSPPLTLEQLLKKDRVVLIDFWTYSCINCQRTLPHLKKWWERYHDKGLVIIGVHTPEFEFEAQDDNLAQAIKDLGIKWPVVNDRERTTWNAYANNFWPRKLLINQEGKIVYDHIGEGGYQETEAQIQRLLKNHNDLPIIDTQEHIHKAGNICYPSSPETYLGYERGSYKNEAYEKLVPNKVKEYQFQASPQPGVSLKGLWAVKAEFVEHSQSTDNYTDFIALVFSGLEVNLVISLKESGYDKVLITLNQKPIPNELKGKDIITQNGRTYLDVQFSTMYRIIKSRQLLDGEELRIYPQSQQFRAHAFTFSGCNE